MHINGQYFYTIWSDGFSQKAVKIIDQIKLPFQINIKKLKTFNDVFNAIEKMEVRGAPLIGVTAAYGIWLGLESFSGKQNFTDYLHELCAKMKTARPTAVNLAFAVDQVFDRLNAVEALPQAQKLAFDMAEEMRLSELRYSELIGEHGCAIIEKLWEDNGQRTLNILTHCNAGWLACIDWGTALAPVYKAHQRGIPLHVWVDETRPRNQGSKLTAFELLHEGIAHTVIADNTGGHLMQHGKVDLVLVGSDRTTRTGDVCNKIGTYLKALAAKDNNVPFYVALPTSSIDRSIADGVAEIPIEMRHADEVRYAEGKEGKTLLLPELSPVANYGFDVTPARLVTGLITEKGVCGANASDIDKLFHA